MKHLTSEVKQQQLEWRRSQVLVLSSLGYSQREIASKLQVDLTAVNRDIQFLRKQAREDLQYHIHDKIPEEYQNCMTGLKRIIKQTTEIAETVTDPKMKLQAFAQLTESYKYIMELTTGGVIVTDAIKYVQSQMNRINKTEKELQQDIMQREGNKGEEEEQQVENTDQQTTTNGIF